MPHEEIVEGSPSIWTDALRRKLHPRRGSGVRLRPRKTAEARARTGELWRSHVRQVWERSQTEQDELTRRAFLLACARLDEGAEAPPPPVDPDLEAAFLALFSARSRWTDPADDFVVDDWMASAGPAFAVEALFGSLRIHAAGDGPGVMQTAVLLHDEQLVEAFPQMRLERGNPGRGLSITGFGHGVLGPWGRLRRLLAGVGEVEWQAARDVAARLRQGASRLEGIGLAFLFPDVPEWAEEEARAVLVDGLVWTPAGALLASLRDGELLERLMSLLCSGYPHLPRAGGKDESEDVAGLALAMAEGAGGAAVPALAVLFRKCLEPRHRRDCAEAVAMVQDERALAFLAERSDRREVAPFLAEAALRFPREAFPALAAEIAGGGKAAKACVSVLARLARLHPDLVHEILPNLPEASRRVLVAALGKAAGDVDEAPPEALPPVLAQPPWASPKAGAAAKSRTAQASAGLRLDPLPQPEEMVWQVGERDEWLAMPMEDEEAVRDDNSAVEFLGLSAIVPLPKDEGTLRGRIRRFRSHTKAFHPGALALMPERLALMFWKELPGKAWRFWRGNGFHRVVAQYELRLLPRLLEMAAERPVQIFPFLLPYRSPRVARLAAAALVTKSARPAAQHWLRVHAAAAATALVPLAAGPAGGPRETAGAALRFLAAEGWDTEVLAAAALYGDAARAAVVAVLAEDPLELFPAKLPKLPLFWQPEGFTRPLLRDRRQALPLEAIGHLGTVLAISRLDEPYAGLAQIKEACDPSSLATFAGDLFQAWLDAGAPAKEGWAFEALGHFGDDGCVHRLVPKIREWPAQNGFARAVKGLDILVALGTDVALMHLHGIAQKAKHKPLQERAAERIEEIAQRRGLTAEDLGDRLVPGLGLEADGSLLLDYGPRSFRVGFDELLKPFVCNDGGKRLPDLPKPVQTDDAQKAAPAQEAWKGLKKSVKALASQQILRLELAMCRRRRWEPDVFRTFLAGHPLLGHLVRRLIWGAWTAEDQLAGTFRVSEDGSFSDPADAGWEWPEGGRIGVVHRLELTEELVARWGEALADYKVLQPFPQIGREVWTIREEEREARELRRCAGRKVPTGKVLGLEQRGWRRGQVMDGGDIAWMAKPLPGRLHEAQLWLDPGIPAGRIAEAPEQALREVVLDRPRGREDRLPFGNLDPVTFSELVRDVEGLLAR